MRAAKARVPLHAQISEVLMEELRKGAYQVGGAFPTEEALTKRFNVSRPTIRQALARLSSQGLILRRARAGSIVQSIEPETVLTHKVTSLREFFNYPEGTVRSLVGTRLVTANRPISRLLQCSEGQPWQLISMIRHDAKTGVPLSWQDIYLIPDYSDLASRADLAASPVYSQVASVYHESIEEAEVEISAESMPSRLSSKLQADTGAPALQVVRRFYRTDGVNFEVSVSTHPYKRFKYRFKYIREFV